MKFLFAAYRAVLSPVLGARCRFHPSCSRYAEKAIEEHGAGKGAWLALRRLGKCHPLHPGGYDPVPKKVG
ncbi:MAG: membrane protein insertion efficiency factor YidD [Pseudomonadota bacterium]